MAGPTKQSLFTRSRNGLRGIEVLAFDEEGDRPKGLHTMLTAPAAASD
jgi:hypothetical protein